MQTPVVRGGYAAPLISHTNEQDRRIAEGAVSIIGQKRAVPAPALVSRAVPI